MAEDSITDLISIVPLIWAGQTLDSFLRQYLRLSRTGIRRIKKIDGFFINGQAITVRYILRGGEKLQIRLPDSPSPSFNPENIPLEIIYEDPDLIVINKPAGMVVHPTKKHQSGTLANALLYHWKTQGEGSASFHPVHRLDRLTSGLILIAKNSWAHQQLDLQLSSGQIHRIYLAICQDIPIKSSAKISLPIESLIESPKRRINPAGQEAFTRYRLLRNLQNASLLAVKLYTGRTHQIRVHLAYLGHPLWGDRLYDSRATDFSRPALHAALLSFIHPRFRRRLRFKAYLPEDIQSLLSKMN